MDKKLKAIIMKVLMFILVWLASMLVIGIVGASLGLDGKIGALFSLIVLFGPVALAILVVLPKKKVRPQKDMPAAKKMINNIPADTQVSALNQSECALTDEQKKLADDIVRALHADSSPTVTVTVKKPTHSTQRPSHSSGTFGKAYHVTGVEHYKNNILNLAIENSDYDMTKRELVDNYMTEERIWKYFFFPTKVDLVPEPDNPYDPNAIKVIVDSEHVGYIKRGSCKHLLKVIAENRLGHVDCDIGGGPYKYVYESDEEYGKYELERDETKYSVVLHIQEFE